MTLMRTTQVNPAEEPFAMLSGKNMSAARVSSKACEQKCPYHPSNNPCQSPACWSPLAAVFCSWRGGACFGTLGRASGGLAPGMSQTQWTSYGTLAVPKAPTWTGPSGSHPGQAWGSVQRRAGCRMRSGSASTCFGQIKISNWG